MVKPSDTVIVLGDFNLAGVSWDLIDGILVPNSSRDLFNQFLNDLSDLSLYQINSVSNNLGKCLDLVFVDDVSNVTIAPSYALITPVDSHHPPLELSLINSRNSCCFISKKSRAERYSFKTADYNKLRLEISKITWPQYDGNAEDSALHFSNSLRHIFSKIIPLVKEANVTSNAQWFTGELKRLKNQKSKAFKLFKKSGLSSHYSAYSILRHKYNVLNKKCYNNYINRVRLNIVSNPKSFYAFVNTKRKTNGYPSTLKLNDLVSSDENIIADMFAGFFESNYSASSTSSQLNSNLSSYPFFLPSFDCIRIPSITAADVLIHLNCLKISYIAGPDAIPTRYVEAKKKAQLENEVISKK
ncbi:PREDICTED: uncharacterized protein LOC108374770 [Rhagoletis zephyria]|uniref:uncharacterized protein LOC108374770 n=1 Tax=Rhagoletis zephyria TaxID=28612 RepID=UPI0008113553|nr:PREDICTED: uncharacterized protein LOC108374770 [Rhagoletis zephyria]